MTFKNIKQFECGKCKSKLKWSTLRKAIEISTTLLVLATFIISVITDSNYSFVFDVVIIHSIINMFSLSNDIEVVSFGENIKSG